MLLKVTINGILKEIEVTPNETLLKVLRREGYYSVKHGCETGECGACAIIFNGKLVNSCIMLALQTQDGEITTVEALAENQKLHPLQEAFLELGAVQCGYCTPAMILNAKILLDENPNPTKEDVKEALAGHLCRCTGYVKPVEAILEAARKMRNQ